MMSFTDDDSFQFRSRDTKVYAETPDWKDREIPGVRDWDDDGYSDIWDLLLTVWLDHIGQGVSSVNAHHDAETGEVSITAVLKGETVDLGNVNYSELPAGSDGIW